MSLKQKRFAVLGAAVVVAAAVAVPLAFGATAVGFLSPTDKKQHDRLTRTGDPSTCHGKANPGLQGIDADFVYDKYTFTNTATTNKCVHVVLQHGCHTFNAFAVAYSQFVPTNPSTNYRGDGSQSDTPQGFSFSVPAGHSYDVVVSEVFPPKTSSCPYLLQVSVEGKQQQPVHTAAAGATD